MKFSEAIRLGAMMTKPARGVFERRRRKYWLFGAVVVHETCALGAAYYAIGRRSRFVTNTQDGVGFRGGVIKKGELTEEMETPAAWSVVMAIDAACPQCGLQGRVDRLIPHLNDDHAWTREAIAAWVEPFDEAFESIAKEKGYADAGAHIGAAARGNDSGLR